MRAFIVIFFILLSGLITAQDNTYYSQESAGVSFKEGPAGGETIIENNSLILMPYIMKEQEVLLIIKEKNNSELNRLLKKVKLAKTFQGIGFAAIPEALLGGGLIGAAAVANKGSFKQKGIGVGLLALSAICLSSSLCFKIQRTKNYKKAIQKYNQLYN